MDSNRSLSSLSLNQPSHQLKNCLELWSVAWAKSGTERDRVNEREKRGGGRGKGGGGGGGEKKRERVAGIAMLAYRFDLRAKR